MLNLKNNLINVVARPCWKFKFFSKSIWRKIIYLYNNAGVKKFNYKSIYDRSSHIPSIFKNSIFKVYKGSGFRNLLINKLNVGMKFGEFAFTRKPFHFPLRKKKSRKFRI